MNHRTGSFVQKRTSGFGSSGNLAAAGIVAAASASPSKTTEDPAEASNIESGELKLHTGMSSFQRTWATVTGYMNSTRLMVLVVLCLQNSMYTIFRRYSQGVLKEIYSKHEILMVAELIKIVFSVWMIQKTVLNAVPSNDGSTSGGSNSADGEGERVVMKNLPQHLKYLVITSKKMIVLAMIYGAMNILSFVALRNISAGLFTIFAQTKILTTATFSTIMLKRQYSWTKWRALVALMMGVLLFSEPIWGSNSSAVVKDGNPILGTAAVVTEVSLSGFASIYFEKVIKMDPLQLGIWERNFQLALGSLPVYIMFILADGGGEAGFFGGWSFLAALLAALGAAGGLLVALSIKYGDSILKTLATTGAIILTGLLDRLFLDGPMTPTMVIAAVQVILAICNYTFDATVGKPLSAPSKAKQLEIPASGANTTVPLVTGTEKESLMQQRV